MPYVTIRQGEKELGWRELDNSLTIGRHRECEVCIVDSRLSRTHCRFEPDGDDWAAVDLGSRNGTWCDGISVDRVLLIEGDTLYAGRCTLTFHAGEPPRTGRYQSRTSARPADPHEALEGTVVGVTVVERPRDPWMAMSSRIRPRPMPRDVDLEPRPKGVGLLDLDLDIEPETRTISNLPRTRFLPRPIKLELPTVEDLQPTGEGSTAVAADPPASTEQTSAPVPAVVAVVAVKPAKRRGLSLDFWLFAVLVFALAAGAITLLRYLPALR
ncbi:MAG: FHA domain-containing protein [Tepidisphaerales bacterium]